MADEAKAALQDATQRLSSLYEELERELSEAEPALATASIALDGLNKMDIGEVKALKKPPAMVENAFAAVVSLKVAPISPSCASLRRHELSFRRPASKFCFSRISSSVSWISRLFCSSFACFSSALSATIALALAR